MNDAISELLKVLIVPAVAGTAGYIIAAFRKASKSDLIELEKKIEGKLKERQLYLIDPIKSSLVNLESRIGDCITARELDLKFSALERRLDDLLSLMQSSRKES